MFFSAASLFVLSILPNKQQLATLDPTWTKVKQSVMKFETNGVVTGLGTLLNDQGLFLAHRTAVASEPILGRLDGASSVVLHILSVDDQTQLVLLQADNWINLGRQGVSVATNTQPNATLIAVTLQGPVKGEFVSGQKIGQIRPSLRYAPLTEIRLESNLGQIGGSLVFDQSGGLVGILGATLGDSSTGNRQQTVKRLEVSAASKVLAKGQPYGPQGMTVAYSLGTSVIRRVVSGFLSENHKVKHPSIGIFYKDSAEPGALIEVVMENSPSALAGLKAGDLITACDGREIKKKEDLALELFQKEVGTTIEIKYKRSGQEFNASIVVGAQSFAN